FFFQAEDGIRDFHVTGVQTCALPISLSLKNIDPKKLAVIAVVSAEVVRANPGNYMNLIREQVAEAFALAFDAAALHGTATPFTTYIGQTTKSTEIGAHPPEDGGVHADIVEGLRLLVND